MTKVWDFLKGKKTYIVALAMIAYAGVVHGWQNNDWVSANQLIMEALAISGLRHGVTNM